jgi:hypothetical protein
MKRVPTGRLVRLLLLLVAPTLSVAVLAVIAMYWHQATRVRLSLTVDRMVLTVAASPAGEGAVTLIGAGQTRTVRLDRVARLEFTADRLETADESRFDLKANRFPDDAWHLFADTPEVRLEPLPGVAIAAPAVTLQAEDGAAPGLIKPVRVLPGATAVMDVGREAGGNRVWLTLGLAPSPGPAQVDVVFPGRFLIYAESLQRTGTPSVTGTPASESLSLRAGGTSNTAVVIQGSTRGLVVQVEPTAGAAALLHAVQIPVTTIDFTRQGPTGERCSSLVGPGRLSYPDLPAKGSLDLETGELVSLDGLKGARIESLGVADAGGQPGLTLALDGTAARIGIGTPEHPQDARLTWFDRVWAEPGLKALFAICVWLFPTTLAGWRLWGELRPRGRRR